MPDVIDALLKKYGLKERPSRERTSYDLALELVRSDDEEIPLARFEFSGPEDIRVGGTAYSMHARNWPLSLEERAVAEEWCDERFRIARAALPVPETVSSYR